MNILLIEDNKKLSRNVAVVLRNEEYSVSVAYTAEEARNKVIFDKYDLIILDLALPDGDGISLCKIWREEEIKTPILMLTARIDIDSKVEGLDSGADDYLTKPFMMKELLARVRAMLRRNSKNKQNLIKFDDLEVDLAAKSVKLKKETTDLSPKEFSILEFLILNKGEAKNATQIYEGVWGSHNSDILFSDSLKVHIANLRKKLGSDIIKTVPGFGYMIDF